jgi:hypothetical protein
MNIHLPAILGFTSIVPGFWPIAMSKYVNIPVQSPGAAGSPLWSRAESGRQPRHTATSCAAGPAAGPGGHGAGANVGRPWWNRWNGFNPQWEEFNELNHVESCWIYWV